MLEVNLIYDFQLLQRGVPTYCNGQFVKMIEPINKDWYILHTTQEIVYARSEKKLSLNVLNRVANDLRLS